MPIPCLYQTNSDICYIKPIPDIVFDIGYIGMSDIGQTLAESREGRHILSEAITNGCLY